MVTSEQEVLRPRRQPRHEPPPPARKPAGTTKLSRGEKTIEQPGARQSHDRLVRRWTRVRTGDQNRIISRLRKEGWLIHPSQPVAGSNPFESVS